jgi:hypothetical protein
VGSELLANDETGPDHWVIKPDELAFMAEPNRSPLHLFSRPQRHFGAESRDLSQQQLKLAVKGPGYLTR